MFNDTFCLHAQQASSLGTEPRQFLVVWRVTSHPVYTFILSAPSVILMPSLPVAMARKKKSWVGAPVRSTISSTAAGGIGQGLNLQIRDRHPRLCLRASQSARESLSRRAPRHPRLGICSILGAQNRLDFAWPAENSTRAFYPLDRGKITGCVTCPERCFIIGWFLGTVRNGLHFRHESHYPRSGR